MHSLAVNSGTFLAASCTVAASQQADRAIAGSQRGRLERTKGGSAMTIREEGNITVVGMMERVDAVTARTAEDELRGVIDDGSKSVLLDFSATKYISSAGLRVVLQAAKGVKAKGGRFGLCSLHEFVQEVFETAGLTSVLDVYESAEVARAHMGSPGGGAA